MSVSTAPRHYELLLILDPSLDERTVAPSIDTFLNV
ncbi:MAG: 30S ribosomal protein S6, partial [Nakamurella sp.]